MQARQNSEMPSLKPWWILIAITFAILAWLSYPFLQHLFRSDDIEPRTVAARGDLAADEQATIELFNQASPTVVYITTRQRVRDQWTRDIQKRTHGDRFGFCVG